MSKILKRPTPEAFRARFGPAAAAHPQAYRLMILAPDGALVAKIPWAGILDCSFEIARHEDVFAWAAMAGSYSSIHSSLLDCSMMECLSAQALHGRIFLRASPLTFDCAMQGFDLAQLEVFDAIAILDNRPEANNSPSLQALMTNMPAVAAGAQVFEIPTALRSILLAALDPTAAPSTKKPLKSREAFNAICESSELAASAKTASAALPQMRI